MDSLVIYEDIKQCLTLSGVAKKQGRHTTHEDLGIIEHASMVVDSEKQTIVWVGNKSDLPKEYQDIANVFSSEGEIWLPELVECHTHFIHAGHRHHDYALKSAGKTYQEISAEGGGILSTMRATREATLPELLERGNAELERFQDFGIGVIEVKSGYGLTLESEIKMLQCVQELQRTTSVLLVPTFLPAHAVPPEFKGKSEEYVNTICTEWIPEVAKEKLARFFDVFIEEGFFSVEQARRLCETAIEHGMKIKLHTDQFNDLGGTALGIELGAASCDHLDHASDENIQKLASSDTVAVMLPGASLYTKTPLAPARKLIDAGARVALSTDFNPGTSPTRNLPLMTTLACSQMGLTVPEAIAGITYNAAAALNLEHAFGSLEPGKAFRVCHLKTDSFEVLPYCFGELD